MNAVFFVNSILLGIALAMDAFSVSLANGLIEPDMKYGRISLIAGVFAFFQTAMPLTGWVCVHTVIMYFRSFEKLIPWIALVLLLFIGVKMLIEGIRSRDDTVKEVRLGVATLLVQGIATSIDALSVGFTIAEYDVASAIICAVIIGAVTFVICVAGICIGKRFGTKLAGRASIFGGILLILIGIEIFVTGFL